METPTARFSSITNILRQQAFDVIITKGEIEREIEREVERERDIDIEGEGREG